MDYKFKENLYPENISYHHFRYVNIYFTTKEQTKEFFKYLFFRVKSEFKLRENNPNICIHVLRNDADYAPLIDFDYNFLVLVIGEWIEHYAVNKTVVKEFRSYRDFKQKNEVDDEGKAVSIKKYRDFKIEFTTKEFLQFDYSYSSWLIGKKRATRFDLVQILFNELLGKHTYVRNYSNRYKSIPITLYLVKDNEFNKYLKFPSVSFLRKTLTTYYTPKQMKELKKMAGKYEKIISTNRAIKSRIEKLKLDEDEIKICTNFDIESIQKTRDLGDGEYHNFVAKEDEDVPDSEFENVENLV